MQSNFENNSLENLRHDESTMNAVFSSSVGYAIKRVSANCPSLTTEWVETQLSELETVARQQGISDEVIATTRQRIKSECCCKDPYFSSLLNFH